MLKLSSTYILTLILFISILSCDRIKRKGHQVVDKTKAAISEKKHNLSDKIIARFDSDTPDTKFNKRRFNEFFKFEPTPDVKEIYCYADEMGIDHDYQFSFYCDTTSLNKIVRSLFLVKGDRPTEFGSGLWHDFFWWDKEKILTLTPYSRKGGHKSYLYLWYDKSKQKAYYFEFDM